MGRAYQCGPARDWVGTKQNEIAENTDFRTTLFGFITKGRGPASSSETDVSELTSWHNQSLS